MPVQIVERFSLGRTFQKVEGGSKSATRYALTVMQDSIRAQIPNPAKGWNMNVPGKGRAGSLRNAVSRSSVRKSGNSFTGRVYIDPGKPAYVYAGIHESGGIIRAVRAPYLVFFYKGRWHRKKSVRIRRKAYWSTGMREAEKDLEASFPEVWWDEMAL